MTSLPELEEKIDGLLATKVSCMVFPGSLSAVVVIPAVGADLDFPSCTVAGLPDNITIIRADMYVSIGSTFDTSSAENQIATGTTDEIRVKENVDTWGDHDIQALVFKALSLQTGADAYRGGTVLFGAIDIKSVVTGNGTYNFRSEETNRTKGVIATGADLELLDVQSFIRVWFI